MGKKTQVNYKLHGLTLFDLLTQGAYQNGKAKLTISGTATGDEIVEPIFELVPVGGGAPVLTLKLMVMPLRVLKLGVYRLEDPNSSETELVSFPSLTGQGGIETVLNDVLKQTGVRFQNGSSGVTSYPYDSKNLVYNDTLKPNLGYHYTSGLRDPGERDGIMKADEFSAFWNDFDPYNDAPGPDLKAGYPEDIVLFVTRRVAVDYVHDMNWEPAVHVPPYVRGGAGSGAYGENNGSTIQLVLAMAHEVLHNLDLFHEASADFPTQVTADNPNGVAPQKPVAVWSGTEHLDQPERAIMVSGEPVNGKFPWLFGLWMRHEDWKTANEDARDKLGQ